MCDRTSVSNNFEWQTDCKVVDLPDSVLQNDIYFGSGGPPALTNNRLTFSVCAADAQDNAGICVVCERATIQLDFECYEVFALDGQENDKFGLGPPALSNDGSKSWTVCDSVIGKCYLCKCFMWI